MRYGWCIAAVTALVCAVPGSAQTAARFQWRAGEVLNYRIAETITKQEVIDGQPSEATMKLQYRKQWQVLAVDAAGAATLQFSMQTFRLEQPMPTGEIRIFDSEHPEQSDPQMREQLSKFVGRPLAVLRIDGQGRLLEVQESKNGPASRFETQLPFLLTLPEQGPTPGQAWERTYAVTLDPPAGVGEKYDAVQTYACQAVQDGVAAVTVATVLKTAPKTAAEQAALLHAQPQGEMRFDLKTGRLVQGRLTVDRELKNHAGEGSRLRLQRVYLEEYVGEK
jgi:hypothetical protein